MKEPQEKRNEKFDPREAFLKMYANLPIPTRKEICVVLDGEPLSFNVVYLEAKHDTEISRRALLKMDELGIL